MRSSLTMNLETMLPVEVAKDAGQSWERWPMATRDVRKFGDSTSIPFSRCCAQQNSRRRILGNMVPRPVLFLYKTGAGTRLRSLIFRNLKQKRYCAQLICE